MYMPAHAAGQEVNDIYHACGVICRPHAPQAAKQEEKQVPEHTAMHMVEQALERAEKQAESACKSMRDAVRMHMPRILRCMRRGHTYADIARILADAGMHISRHTLAQYVREEQKRNKNRRLNKK